MTNTRPSSLELVRAYEERHEVAWMDLVTLATPLVPSVWFAFDGDYAAAMAMLPTMALMCLMFEESAQNAYEYQHREGW